MTSESLEEKTAEESPGGESETPAGPPWVRASLADLSDFDFEEPAAKSQSADSAELGDFFRAAADGFDQQAAADTPASRVFEMLSAMMGMHFKPQEPNEPFGAMAV